MSMLGDFLEGEFWDVLVDHYCFCLRCIFSTLRSCFPIVLVSLG